MAIFNRIFFAITLPLDACFCNSFIFIQNPRGWEDKDRWQIQLKPIALLFEENISKFLEHLKLGKSWESSYTMLYNTAYTLINRLQMEMYSEEERRFDIEDWRKLWEIMEQILVIFIKCGNAVMACDIIQELYFYDCPNNSDNLKGKKFDDKNETKSSRLYFNKISLEWMNGQDPQPLIDQIPKNVSNIPYRSLRLQSNQKAKRIILFVDARAIMHIYGILYQIHRELNSPASIHTKG